jgi:hypothetical protein
LLVAIDVRGLTERVGCEVGSARRTHWELQGLQVFKPKYLKEGLDTDDMTPLKCILEAGQKG